MLRIIIGIVIAVGGGLIAPPVAGAEKCGSGYYWSRVHAQCVERPDTNSRNATALCVDGLWSHSLTPGADENCAGHGGVAQMCPCGGAVASAFNRTAMPGPEPARRV
ncbi:hypothetical protein MAUB_46820 [Mycolicibacterium aubagnense]|uniref:Uncharacterized protein n=1 Tax=Mycolicibacterium aubagnense TaxID=319707 RepID=A0ABM7IJH5_9MYCO|nr:hypothetical protein MAUB_46820 [Mycolicibacterium aubagnense]